MRQRDLVNRLRKFDRKGRRVFNLKDLRKIFPEETDESFRVRLRAIAALPDSPVRRATRGIYVFTDSARGLENILEEIAKTARRGDHSYLSLESALSEHGLISQVMVGRITVMTTGRSGTFKTPWGDIEFTHTERDPEQFVDDLLTFKGRPLRMANKELALRDIRRVGRNVQLLDLTMMEDEADAQFC